MATNQATASTKGIQIGRASSGRKITSGIMVTLMVIATLLAIVPLVWVLYSVISQGLRLNLTYEWWSQDINTTTFRFRGGGALHAILGTIIIGLITTAISVPIAIIGAIFLIEYARGTKAARIVSFAVDILSGIPSIVAALFIYALFVTTLGFNISAFLASLALVILMIPVVLRSTEEMLKLVPDSLREASYAMGIPKWKTIVKIVIPTAFGGIATGVVLGMARVMGETAPLLVLTMYDKYVNTNPFSNTFGTLPMMINDGRGTSPNCMDYVGNCPGYERLWGAALTLILLVMGLNLLARWMGWFATRKLRAAESKNSKKKK